MRVLPLLRLLVVLGAGIIAALQIGKGVIAIPLIQAAMDLSLVQVSAVLSVFGVFGALAAMPVGVSVPRIGPRRCLLAGLALISLGSFLGGFADNFSFLILTRILEGGGFIAIATAAPTILAALADPRNRDVIFGAWGTYMPVGMSAMILTGILVEVANWSMLWLANGFLAAVWFCLAFVLLPSQTQAAAPAALPALLPTLKEFARDRRPLLIAFAFFCYGSLYFAIVGFFPVYLIDQFGSSLSSVAPLTASVVFSNAIGNFSAGLILKAGMPLPRLIATAFAIATILAAVLFTAPSTALEATVLACLAIGVAGLIPGSTMAAAPRIARHPGQVGAVIGLFMQFSTLGQFVGPAAFAFVVESYGWNASIIGLGLLALIGATFALLAGRVEASRRAPTAVFDKGN